MSINFNSSSLNIIFAGTSEFAAHYLLYLINYSKHKIISIITQPDKIFGKKYIYSNHFIKNIAKKNNIPILQPLSLKDNDFCKKIKKIDVDLILVISYGLIFPQYLLEHPKLGCINIHASLLPRWRGAAPIQYAIISGDKITGATSILMNKKMDAGDIITQIPCKISQKDNYLSLRKKLINIGIIVMIKTINKLTENKITFKKQNEYEATYSKKISKKDAQINWSLSAINLERYIRAFIPWPVNYFYLNNYIIRVWESNVIDCSLSIKQKKPGEIICVNNQGIQIGTSKGILNITKLQLQSKNIMTAKNFLNSKRSWFIPGSFIL